MDQGFLVTPSSLADCAFAEALPKSAEISKKELDKIKIPGWRYDQIDKAVLDMFEKADVKTMPLPILDLGKKLNCVFISYGALGTLCYRVLVEISKDAFLLCFRFSEKTIILFNDRSNSARINYSIMHEIAHLVLGHSVHCPLAEKEANYFAQRALCPIELLEHYNINDAKSISEIFGVSSEFAKNRLRSVENRKKMFGSNQSQKTRDAIIKRFSPHCFLKSPEELIPQYDRIDTASFI